VDLNTVGGDLLVWAAAVFSATTTSIMSLAFMLDGAAEVGDMNAHIPSASFQINMSTVWLFTGVAAGSHNIRTRWRTNAGTATATSTNRQLLVVELKR